MAKLTRTTLPPPVPRRRPTTRTDVPSASPTTPGAKSEAAEKPGGARRILEPSQPPEHDVLEHGEPAVEQQQAKDSAPTLQPKERPLDARALEQMKAIPMLDAKQVEEPKSPPDTAMYALDHAQEQGVYFQEEPNDPDHPEEEDPELAAAVEEAISLLFGVRGIHHIGPGRNELDEKVVVIAAGRGFGEKSLAAIPEKVREFKTLLALPYDMLPLRKER